MLPNLSLLAQFKKTIPTNMNQVKNTNLTKNQLVNQPILEVQIQITSNIIKYIKLPLSLSCVCVNPEPLNMWGICHRLAHPPLPILLSLLLSASSSSLSLLHLFLFHPLSQYHGMFCHSMYKYTSVVFSKTLGAKRQAPKGTKVLKHPTFRVKQSTLPNIKI